jgi:hypothetical protein
MARKTIASLEKELRETQAQLANLIDTVRETDLSEALLFDAGIEVTKSGSFQVTIGVRGFDLTESEIGLILDELDAKYHRDSVFIRDPRDDTKYLLDDLPSVDVIQFVED